MGLDTPVKDGSRRDWSLYVLGVLSPEKYQSRMQRTLAPVLRPP